MSTSKAYVDQIASLRSIFDPKDPAGYIGPSIPSVRCCGSCGSCFCGKAEPRPSPIGLSGRRLDQIDERKSHPLKGLLDIVTMFVSDYEGKREKIPEASPADVLRFLMEQKRLRKGDFVGLFGSRSNVSDVLSGEREISAREARDLGKRFGVSPAVFI